MDGINYKEKTVFEPFALGAILLFGDYAVLDGRFVGHLSKFAELVANANGIQSLPFAVVLTIVLFALSRVSMSFGDALVYFAVMKEREKQELYLAGTALESDRKWHFFSARFSEFGFLIGCLGISSILLIFAILERGWDFIQGEVSFLQAAWASWFMAVSVAGLLGAVALKKNTLMLYVLLASASGQKSE